MMTGAFVASAEDRVAAITVIASELPGLSDDRLKAMLCAAVGHPPVVEMFFGQVTCARCSAMVGDALAGAWNGRGKMVVGHDCDECSAVREDLTPEQRLLTKLDREPEPLDDGEVAP